VEELDNEKRGENTLGGLRCCSNLCCKKTEEKNVIKLFKLVHRGLSGELNGKLSDIKPLKLLVELQLFRFNKCFSLNSGNMILRLVEER
jgi:hypothetical protein